VGAVSEQPAGVIEEISPNDAMYAGHREHYFMVGRVAVEWIRIALHAAGRETVETILDLPCGHGRVLRAIKAAFPEARLAACDIDRDGVDFCADVFGATPIYGTEDPRDLELPADLDLVWCGSLLTHVSSERWPHFLEAFHSALAPGGVLVFTSHGRSRAEKLRAGTVGMGLTGAQTRAILAQYDREGFGYQDFAPENLNSKLTSSLSSGYGMSLATPAWVCEVVQQVDGLSIALYSEEAWPRDAGPQDVIACVRAG
jgi:SAM-dependent methyltransferase